MNTAEIQQAFLETFVNPKHKPHEPQYLIFRFLSQSQALKHSMSETTYETRKQSSQK